MFENLPNEFVVEAPAAKTAWKVSAPTIPNADEKKKAFGLELAKHPPFQAACAVFGEDTNTALWVSQNWINDPIVLAVKDKYLEAADTSQTLLDKSQLARRLLNMADEKDATKRFYLLDGKDRLKALELYSKVMGYTDTKPDPTLTQNFVHNNMTIKLVEPEKKATKIIDNEPNEQIENINTSPIKLKLVG